jgi:hypothetical protein
MHRNAIIIRKDFFQVKAITLVKAMASAMAGGSFVTLSEAKGLKRRGILRFAQNERA